MTRLEELKISLLLQLLWESWEGKNFEVVPNEGVGVETRAVGTDFEGENAGTEIEAVEVGIEVADTEEEEVGEKEEDGFDIEDSPS